MEHFVRIIFENHDEVEKLDESIFPEQKFLETKSGAHVIEIALPRALNDDESDEYANRLAEYMFEQGYQDFDIEISMDGE